MKVNFIGLLLENDHLNYLHNILRNEYMEYLDIPKCVENGLVSGIDSEPHITLGYNQTYTKGPNWYYWLIFIKNKELINKLRESSQIKVKEAVLDTFDNPDCRVLKFNMNNSNVGEVLDEYHKLIEETAEVDDGHGKYNPHITLTYLKKSTPDQVIDDIKSKILLSNYNTWDISGIKIGGDKPYTFPLR